MPVNPIGSSAARVIWVDALKGFGIILVVIGHITSNNSLVRFIYFFHMPLFFWISGYLFSLKENRILYRRIISGMALPYISFLILVTILDIIQHNVTGHSTSLPISDPIKSFAIAIYGGSKLSAAYAVFWFMPCLAISVFMINLILHRNSANSLRCFFIFSLLLFAGYFVGRFPLPLAINLVPTAMTIIWLGILIKPYFDKSCNYPWIILITLTAGILGSMLFAPMNMKNGMFGTPLATLITSICLIYSLSFILITYIPNTLLVVLSSLGKSSLVIMFLHQVINVALGSTVEEWEKIVICVVLPYGFYMCAEQFLLTKKFFLGRT